MFAGGSCAAGVACFALDMATTPPVAATATRTAAPASTHVFRITGPLTPAAAAKSRHFCIAALRMLMPPGRCRGWDSIRVDEGPIRGGVREVLHAVVADALGELEARRPAAGASPCVPVNPGGSRSLHALMACLNAALFVSSDEPFATPSMVNSPDASGSGNALTPLSRMHSANFTAFS